MVLEVKFTFIKHIFQQCFQILFLQNELYKSYVLFKLGNVICKMFYKGCTKQIYLDFRNIAKIYKKSDITDIFETIQNYLFSNPKY